MLPAGVVERIDLDEEKVYVERTKGERAAARVRSVVRIRPGYPARGTERPPDARTGAPSGGTSLMRRP
jgi:hypothetical protein